MNTERYKSKLDVIVWSRWVYPKFSLIITGLLLCTPFNQNLYGIEHPYVIVQESDYSELRARAANWPWSVMKTRAINDATNLKYDPNASYNDKCYKIAPNIAGSCALA